jgi:hypothetical protein
MIKVKAIGLGFFGKRRVRPGTVFILSDEKQFSKRWMEKVEADKPAPKEPAASEPAPEVEPVPEKGKGKAKVKAKEVI